MESQISNDIMSKIERYKRIALEKEQIVTLFMLTHNREYYVKLAIDSVLKQTYKNFQLIVLDNCSEDNTRQVVCSFQDPRIIYIYRESTMDDSNTKFGMENCITKYFIVFHDDDIVEPEYLETVLNEMESNSYTALSVSGEIIDEDGIVKNRWCNDSFDKIEWKNGEYLKQFFSRNGISMIYPAVIYRTEFYKTFPSFGGNSKIGPAGDQFIWFYTEKHGGVIALINKVLFQYRVHKNQDSNTKRGFMELQLLDYLIDDEFYSTILDINRKDLYQYIWKMFVVATNLYVKKLITSEKYKSFLSFRIIHFVSLRLKGKLLVLRLWICYLFRVFIKVLYYFRKRLRK